MAASFLSESADEFPFVNISPDWPSDPDFPWEFGRGTVNCRNGTNAKALTWGGGGGGGGPGQSE